MKKGTALLLVLALLAGLIISAGAEDGGLLYPGCHIVGENVYLTGIKTGGGSFSVTANGTPVACEAVKLEDSDIGITYYCVVSITSSLSKIQKDQQRAGLIALSEGLRPNDRMVLIPMGVGTVVGQPLTPQDDLVAAIDQTCVYAVFGTRLNEGLISSMQTAVQDTAGASCLVVFSDGMDTTDVVKYTDEQAARLIGESGAAVHVVALLTPPVTSYASKQANRLHSYASASLGGTYHAPLLEEGKDYTTAAADASADILASTCGRTALRLSAADLPRTEKELTLTVTWTGDGTTITDTVSFPTAALPALPKPTEPPTAPPTEPPATEAPTRPMVEEPATIAPEETIPQYQDPKEAEFRRYYLIGIIAFGAVLVLIVIVLIFRRHEKKKYMAPLYPVERLEVPQTPQKEHKAPLPAMPAEKEETPKSPQTPPTLDAAEAEQEAPEELTEEAPEEAAEEVTVSEVLPEPVMEGETLAEDAEDRPLSEELAELELLLRDAEAEPENADEAPTIAEPEEAGDSPTVAEPEKKEPEAPRSAGRGERQRKGRGMREAYSARRAAQRQEAERRTEERRKQTQTLPAPETAAEVPAPTPAAPTVPTCTIRLTPEDNPGGTVYITMESNSSRTLGRNNKADVILSETDTSLSGLHFELQWDGRALYLTDRGSTNGTALSGIPQRPGHWARVENGTTILAGSQRYKVHISKK